MAKRKQSCARAAKAKLSKSAPLSLVDQLVTKEAQAHGDYVKVTLAKTEDDDGPGGEKGARVVVMNRGGSTIDRWEASGALDDTQMSAIKKYRHAHHLAFGTPSIGQDWGRLGMVQIRGTLTISDFIADAIEAKDTLLNLDKEVFGRMPRSYFDVWQNVVLHDEPAGIAGGRLGFKGRNGAQYGAQADVSLIAHQLVIHWRL